MILKLIKTSRFWLLAWIINIGVSFAQNPEDHFFYGDSLTDNPSADINGMIKDDIINSSSWPWKWIISVFRLDPFIDKSDLSALELAKYIINIALGLISFIALIVIIYGFAQIFFAKDDEGVSKAKKIVQGAAIAIAIIAVSRFVISFLFDLYGRFIA